MATIQEMREFGAKLKAAGKLKEVTTAEPQQTVAPNLPVLPGLMPGKDQMDSLSRGPLPASASTNVDQLRNWESPAVPAMRISPQPISGNVTAGAAANSSATKAVLPVLTVATKAQSTANNANSTAAVASAGVTTINSQAAVAIVGGILKQVPISTLGTTPDTPTPRQSRRRHHLRTRRHDSSDV